ncbi:SRPBCC family protein [Sporosarcina ureae]|uniref:SRPBCC family protein n=1 Tax=Sporosarcina ureae TaxID=1571 RepID=UPI0009DC7AFB|nr:SRPBCC domain-containing protein [Sporosarcina ureae]ARF16278.1 ATPase [Sporosarcina ureae]
MADITVDFQFSSSIEEVWKALTDSEMLAKWIWKNDFAPVIGEKFQFRSEPNEWWDGIIHGEVLEVEEPHILSYTWASAGETTTITWTLSTSSNGATHVYFEQTGFSEETKATKGAIEGARYSWMNFGDQLKKVVEQ